MSDDQLIADLSLSSAFDQKYALSFTLHPNVSVNGPEVCRNYFKLSKYFLGTSAFPSRNSSTKCIFLKILK